jgi:hemerythrin superfamily protein
MPNAIEMLREDHRKVKDLFEHFEGTDSGDKKEIVDTTLRELEIHTSIEEEIFYPAARLALQELEGDEGDDVIDEAWEEHHVVKLIAAELKKMRSSDERYDAKFTVLAESVKHHIKEEEEELFPKLESHIDGEELGEKMMVRKQKLQQRTDNGSKNRSRSSKTRTRSNRSKAKKRMQKRRSASGGRR